MQSFKISYLIIALAILLLGGVILLAITSFGPRGGHKKELKRPTQDQLSILESSFHIRFPKSTQFINSMLVRGKDYILLMKIMISTDEIQSFKKNIGFAYNYSGLNNISIRKIPGVKWWDPHMFDVKEVVTSMESDTGWTQQILIAEKDSHNLVIFISREGGPGTLPKDVYQLYQ